MSHPDSECHVDLELFIMSPAVFGEIHDLLGKSAGFGRSAAMSWGS